MKKPIDSMTVTPFGEDYMVDAWFALLLHSYTIEEHREAFYKETGIKIEAVVQASGLMEMIDRNTGYQKDAIVKFADWVTENLWGVEI